MTNKTRWRELVGELRNYDHVFLSVEGAHYFAEPFGLVAQTYVATATPREPKGLTLADDAQTARGIGAHDLACQICDHLGVNYPHDIFGRGAQLRACCDALEHWLAT